MPLATLEDNSAQIETVTTVHERANVAEVTFSSGLTLALPPFVHVKCGDRLRVTLAQDGSALGVVKLLGPTSANASVKVHPPYCAREVVSVPPHDLELTFRERHSCRDWNGVRALERFHYRGRGLNRLVGRRTVLVLEAKDLGVIGYGVLCSTLSSAKPRFQLFGTTFTEQMRSKQINKLVRIPRIVIHPEFRGLGLGALMARHLVRFAREHWDTNGVTPVLVEVIASMTDYNRFFEAAGFVPLGRTGGERARPAVKPKYGRGSFSARRNATLYKFFADGLSRPYLVHPLTSHTAALVAKQTNLSDEIATVSRIDPQLRKPVLLKKVSATYRSASGSSARAREVCSAFGVDESQFKAEVLRDLTLNVAPGDVVLVTGASGSGKSTLLKLLAGTLERELVTTRGCVQGAGARNVAVLSAGSSTRPLVDQVGKNTREAIEILNGVGLAEAHLYLKPPNQLSEGQRYRFAVARLCDSGAPIWVADEFASALDPLTAAVVAKGLRRVAARKGATLFLAAPHIDHFVESLCPNKLVRLHWGGTATVCGARLEFSSISAGVKVRVRNVGQQRLTDVSIGVARATGRLELLARAASLDPRAASDTVFIPNEALRGTSAIVARSMEDVGDVLYVTIKRPAKPARTIGQSGPASRKVPAATVASLTAPGGRTRRHRVPVAARSSR